MAYNNNYRYNQQGYSRNNNGFQSSQSFGNGYHRPSYGNNYGGGHNYQQQQQPKKKSGCKFTTKDGIIFVSAWKVQKGQLITMYARPYKNTKRVESKNGKEWLNYFVTITNKTTLQQTNTSAMFCPAEKRLFIKEFNLIATNGGRGGYFGKHISK